MVRIVNCCYLNLNQKNAANELLGDDITNEITIGTSPTTLLSTASSNRRIVKIYSMQYSNPLALLWVRHGSNASASNSSFALPMWHLYENLLQASRPLSVACSEGTALLRLTVVNKL